MLIVGSALLSVSTSEDTPISATLKNGKGFYTRLIFTNFCSKSIAKISPKHTKNVKD